MLTETIASSRGLESLSAFSISAAGDVGRKLLARIDNLDAAHAIGDAIDVTLLSGQSFSFAVRALKAEKGDKGRFILLTGHDDVFQMADVAPRREQVFMTMSRAEEIDYREDTKDMMPKYDVHIKIGDSFGRGGWTTGTVAAEIMSQAGLSIVSAIPAHQVRQFTCRPNTSFVEALLELYKIYEPTVWVSGGSIFLFAFDTMQAQTGFQSEYIPAIRNAHLATREIRKASVAANSFYLHGGLGPFKPDKYPGKTWTVPSRISMWGLNIRSVIIKKLLARQSTYGGYETSKLVEESEFYISETTNLWTLGVTGRRNVQLLSLTSVYIKPTKENRYKKELVSRSELINLYEHNSWANETPRLWSSVKVISAKVWKLNRAKTEIVNGWLEPISIERTNHSYDERGFHIEDTKVIRSAVYASADCENSDPSLPGYCTVGAQKCDYYLNAKCSIGRTCNRYGRLATCTAYTGQARRCKKQRDYDRGLTFYYRLDCLDSTVYWEKVLGASPSDITDSSIIKTDVEDDPECLVHDEVETHTQITAQTYRYSSSKYSLENGKRRHSTYQHDVNASHVPSHLPKKRGMTVFAENESGAPLDTPQPRVDRHDDNLVDWDDAEAAAKDIVAELRRDIVEDIYIVPGEVLFDKLSPFAVPDESDGSHLPFDVSTVGFVVESEVNMTTSREKGMATSKITVRR